MSFYYLRWASPAALEVDGPHKSNRMGPGSIASAHPRVLYFGNSSTAPNMYLPQHHILDEI